MSEIDPNVMAYRLMKLEQEVKEQDQKLQDIVNVKTELKVEVKNVKDNQLSIQTQLKEQGEKLDEILKRLTEKDIVDAHNKGKFTGGWWVISGLFTAATAFGALVASFFSSKP